MKVADLDSRAVREPLVAMCEAYGIDPDHAAVCIVTEEVERRRVLLAADVGLIDAVSAAIAGHPSGEWALEHPEFDHVMTWPGDNPLRRALREFGVTCIRQSRATPTGARSIEVRDDDRR